MKLREYVSGVVLVLQRSIVCSFKWACLESLDKAPSPSVNILFGFFLVLCKHSISPLVKSSALLSLSLYILPCLGMSLWKTPITIISTAFSSKEQVHLILIGRVHCCATVSPRFLQSPFFACSNDQPCQTEVQPAHWQRFDISILLLSRHAWA